MSGKDIVLDTNILLYFLSGDLKARKFFNEYNPIISFTTGLELLSAPEISQNQKMLIHDLLSVTSIVKYSDEHKEDITKVRSQKKLKLPDAIIASLAITLGVPLATADKALKNIQGLDVLFYNISDNE
jgi:predicted nucleic acid-binding protein